MRDSRAEAKHEHEYEPEYVTSEFSHKVKRALERAVVHALSIQNAPGSWHVEPDPRAFDTALVAYVLNQVPRPEARSAASRARRWLDSAEPQRHDSHAQLLDETPRRLLDGGAAVLDLEDPTLYGDLMRRKTLLLYVLGLHAGAEVKSPLRPEKVKAQVREIYERSATLTLKRWGKIDLISVYAILEHLDGNSAATKMACQQLARMQSDDGSYCHNPVSTAIAFLALNVGAQGSPTWQSCLDYFLSAQREDGTWRFCISDVWDTSLMMRSYGEHPLFNEAASRAARFLISQQNHDGGWGFRRDVESDNDTSSCVLLALRGHDDEESLAAVERGIAYLLRVQRRDGLWNTWQSSEDHPVEDCVAHAVGALAAYRGSSALSIRRAQKWLGEQYQTNGRWRAGWYRNLPYSILEVSKGLPAEHPLSYAAVRSLRDLQNLDGGFAPEAGELSCASASGLALAALAEHHCFEQPFLRRALTYLVTTQRSDGSWDGHAELFGPRPLMYHLPTNTHAFAGMGLVAAWRRISE